MILLLAAYSWFLNNFYRIFFYIRKRTNIKLGEGIRFKTGYLDIYRTENFSEEIKQTYMSHREYIGLSLEVNKSKDLDYGRDRSFFYERCADLAGRDILSLENASKEEIQTFINRNPRFVAKTNRDSGGKGFSVYRVSDYKSTEKLLQKITDRNQMFLEGFITQHAVLNKIYPDSVNTVRIHTVNHGGTIKTFFKPKLRIGCGGSAVDSASCFGSMRGVLEDDGSLVMPSIVTGDHYVVKRSRHPDTGIELTSVKIPFVQESKELCVTAAARFPELPYIAWDVAITENGPVLVEANSISGCFVTYQLINILYHGKGLRKELLEMFAYAGVDVEKHEQENRHC